MTRNQNQMNGRLGWTVACALTGALSLGSPACLGKGLPAPNANNHFVLLIDASGDMAKNWGQVIDSLSKDKKNEKRAGVIASVITDTLFAKNDAGGAASQDDCQPTNKEDCVPKIRPGVDTVSVAFYGLAGWDSEKQNPECGDATTSRIWITPDGALSWPPNATSKPQDRDGFRKSLEKLITTCGFRWQWSPIATAGPFSLNKAGKQADARAPIAGNQPTASHFGHLYIVNVSNLAYNDLASTEIHSLVRRSREAVIKGKGKTDELKNSGKGSQQVDDAVSGFRFVEHPQWRFHYDNCEQRLMRGFVFEQRPTESTSPRCANAEGTKKADAPFHLTITKVEPYDLELDRLIHYEPALVLDRRAIGPNLITVVDEKDRRPVISIEETKGMKARLLSWSLEAQPGTPGPFPGADKLKGDTPLPDTNAKPDPETPCIRPAGKPGTIECDLYKLTGFTGRLAGADPLPTKGNFSFSVIFDYRPGIYDLLTYESATKSIALGVTEVPSFKEQPEFDLPKLTIGNPELAQIFCEKYGQRLAGLNCPQSAALATATSGAQPGGAAPDPVMDTQEAKAFIQEQREEKKKEISAARVASALSSGRFWLIIAYVIGPVIGVLLALWAWWRARIPFKPELLLPKCLEAAIDFNAATDGNALVLIAKPLIENTGRAPLQLPSRLRKRWLGLAQPHQWGRIEVVGIGDLTTLGVELAPGHELVVGFAPDPHATGAASGQTAALPLTAALGRLDAKELQLSDGTVFHLFVAPGAIADLHHACGDDGIAKRSVPITLRISWHENEAQPPKTVTEESTLTLSVIPERDRPPLVVYRLPPGCVALPIVHEFQNDPDRDLDPKLACGWFDFLSRADHAFAQTARKAFELRAFRENRPLPNGAIGFRQDCASALTVEVAPQQRVVEPVMLYCDGLEVPNPNPPATRYGFQLAGTADPESDLRMKEIILRRDPTKAEVALTVRRGGETPIEVFYKETGVAYQRLREGGAQSGPEVELVNHVVELPPWPDYACFDNDNFLFPICEVTVGNSGRYGDGRVEVHATADFETRDGVLGGARLSPGKTAKDLIRLGVIQTGTAQQVNTRAGRLDASIPESDRPEPLVFELLVDCSVIERVPEGRIEHDQATAVLRLDFEVITDRGAHSGRSLEVRQPLGLEQLPKKDWLCVDFGTSAIAVAVGQPSGTAGEDAIELIELQQTEQPNGKTLDDSDPLNVEHGSPFLPSFLACDADLRRTAEAGENYPNPGFPGYRPAHREPGHASFVSLPATTEMLRVAPGCIVYSLKSWVAHGADSIAIIGPEGRPLEVPTQRLLRSAFGALLSAYLPPERIANVGRVVLTCPNTFSDAHKEMLKEAAVAVFAPFNALDIPLADRISLVSESDAVAFEYIRNRLADGFAPPKLQHLLVYDFGAGTLDLSVLRIEWFRDTSDSPHIREWAVIGRLGLPLAGNHIDSLIARIVHDCLKDPTLVDGQHLEYRWPIVGEGTSVRTDHGRLQRHRSAAINLWNAIRKAKGDWNGRIPMQIPVGGSELVSASTIDRVLVIRDEKIELPTQPPDDAHPALWLRGREVVLQVPAARIKERLEGFITLVTETVIDECLGTAGVPADAIDTVVLAGRSTLWPDLARRLKDRLPRATIEPACPESGPQGLKKAVVRGAIARHVQQELATRPQERAPRQYRLLFPLSKRLEKIDLDRAETTIRWEGDDKAILFQVNSRTPSWSDFQDRYRRFFFLQASREFRKETLWKDGSDIIVVCKGDTPATRTPYKLRPSKNLHRETNVDERTTSEPEAVRPPWPIGRHQLSHSDLV